MAQITAQPGIMDISLYQSGAAHIEGVRNAIKLSSNENPLGPSPAAREAYIKGAQNLHRYPSSDQIKLRQSIAKVLGLDAQRIICGAGSDEIIAFLCQAFAGPGDEVIYTEHGFAMYRISALAVGATPIEVPEKERVTDIDAILCACNGQTKLVFLANPNNPTGTMIGLDEIERLARQLLPQTLLVLDGAYAEYVAGYDGGAALVEAHDNVFMTRTFSKIYGLGSLRVGWGYGPQNIVDVLNRLRGPFNLSQSAIDAATAAMEDTAYTEYCRMENEKWRVWMAQALAEIGVPSDVSHANFILARFKSAEEAAACNAHLQKQGLIVRAVAGYNLPDALRITVGDESACRQIVDAIREFKAGVA